MSDTELTQGGAGSRPAASDKPDPLASAKQAAGEIAQTVKEESASFAAAAKDKAQEKATATKESATQAMGDFASAIRRAGEELAERDQGKVAQLVKQAAAGLEEFAQAVSQKSPEELLEAARDLGRRNPAMLAAGSVVAGLLLGRFLRSSAEPDADESPVPERSAPPPTPYPASPGLAAFGGATPQVLT